MVAFYSSRGLYLFQKSVFFWKEWFFSKKPPFVTKTFSFRENLHFNNSKCVFPAFCKIFGPIGGQSLEICAILTRPNPVSLKFICDSYSTLQMLNYCLKLSLLYQRILQIGLNRNFFVLWNRLEGGVLYKLGSKVEFFLK